MNWRICGDDMASEEEDGAFTVKSSDLKTSLRELAFRDDEDINPESLARAREMISVLEEIDLKNGADSNSGYAISFKVPDHFKCPLSNKLMRDPVLLHSSGEVSDLVFHFWIVNCNSHISKFKINVANSSDCEC